MTLNHNVATTIIVAMYLIELNLYGKLKGSYCKWLNLNSNNTLKVR